MPTQPPTPLGACVSAATPTTVALGPGPGATIARLGASLANFVYIFGQPIACGPGTLEFRGQDFTIDVPRQDPVRSLWVTALKGETWNSVDEDRICEGFFPPNPNLITTLTSPMREFYSTDGGDIVYLPKDSMCAMQFTEA